MFPAYVGVINWSAKLLLFCQIGILPQVYARTKTDVCNSCSESVAIILDKKRLVYSSFLDTGTISGQKTACLLIISGRKHDFWTKQLVYAPKLTFGNEIIRKTHESATILDAGNKIGQNGNVSIREAVKLSEYEVVGLVFLETTMIIRVVK